MDDTDQRWITRVAMEFVYGCDVKDAQSIHDQIVQSVTEGARQLDDAIQANVHTVETRIASATRPMLAGTRVDFPPGGSETTKTPPNAPGGTEQTEASEVCEIELCPDRGKTYDQHSLGSVMIAGYHGIDRRA